MIKRKLLCGLVLAAVASVAHAHPGSLNAKGCYNNRKTGEYHCHGGGRAAPSPSDQREQLNSLYDALSSGKQSNSAGSALPPGCYVGPPGGTYTITKRGGRTTAAASVCPKADASRILEAIDFGGGFT